MTDKLQFGVMGDGMTGLVMMLLVLKVGHHLSVAAPDWLKFMALQIMA